MSLKRVAAVMLFVVLIGLLAWGWSDYVGVCLRLAMADEQTMIFDDMVTQASIALSASPPNVTKAVECLQYAHLYYPSGTKQLAGTPLDRIVERSRKSCEMRIIDILRKATAKDCGDDPEKWIGEYLSPLSTQQGEPSPPLD